MKKSSPKNIEERGVTNRPNFKDIQPLLLERKHDKQQRMLYCVFACPATLRRVEASVYIQQGTGVKDRVIDAVARSFWWEVRGTVTRTIASFLPAGFIRNVVQNSAWHMSYGSSDDIVTSQELDQATVDAFLSVHHEFRNDGSGWKAREVVENFVTDFDRLLRRRPITTRYEGEILSRVLTAVALLDGQGSEEAHFIESFAPFLLTKDKPNPSRIELSELESEVKPTIYLLAGALAKIDKVRTREEYNYLKALSRDLELSAEQVRELDRAAAQFVVEQSLHISTVPTPDDIRELAAALDLESEEVERVLVRRRKRASA